MAVCSSALVRDGFVVGMHWLGMAFLSVASAGDGILLECVGQGWLFVGVCWLGMAFLCVASARDGFVGMHQLGMPFLSVA